MSDRRWSRIELVTIAIAAAVLASAVLSNCGPRKAPPRLVLDESVASDFGALAMQTWEQFTAVFEARSDCFGDVRLRAVYELNSRATYNPDTATVSVRVPGTPAMLQSALIHEWAHHVEFQCEEHKDLRPAFLAAMGLPADTPWRTERTSDGSALVELADMPSEQYAEATIALVLGRRPVPTDVHVMPQAVRVVAEWAAGD